MKMNREITDYNADIIQWARQQAALLRAGRFSALDIEHIAEEIEDVGKSEERELESRLAVLIAHLLKWQYQPEKRGASWRLTIAEQRRNDPPAAKKNAQPAERITRSRLDQRRLDRRLHAGRERDRHRPRHIPQILPMAKQRHTRR